LALSPALVLGNEAIRQSAYLLLVPYYGYDFARNPSSSPLREQIIRPDEPGAVDNIVVLGNEAAIRILDGQQAAVIFIGEPIRALLAVLRFRSPGGIDMVLGVVLPGPDEPSLPQLDLKTFTGAVVPYEPELVAELMSFDDQNRHWLGGTP
jgi:hypothetical protein